ncbi:hypothetical protein RhiirA4_461527 [Rhizophagus irregularis]|uniref:Protein kinase domain-containing protein n=1 Tax=Rhizophagus irregularis TaxID=588596 RepID=A0A2I1GJ15_9GLOM|nr:hypothetical protein RhiirA4_461527 [Rhizophagus irregularis]
MNNLVIAIQQMKERIKIAYEIILTLYFIHKEKAIHRDLHSGNILYSQFNDLWYISVVDLLINLQPKSVPGTPLEYKNLMKECWDANSLKRPDN